MAAREKPPEAEERSRSPRPPYWPGSMTGLYILAAALMLLLWSFMNSGSDRRSISYSEFKAHLAAGAVVEAMLADATIDGRIEPTAVSGDAERDFAEEAADEEATAFLFRTVRVDDPDLVAELLAANVEFSARRSDGIVQTLLAWVLPFAILIAVWMFLLRRVGMGASQSAMSFGKSRAKLIADREVGVTFADVAGCEEAKAELEEVVAFLGEPERFTKMGARIPHGLLLVGPPGTGKTLLARAVAGEAGVPFFSLSGSDFVEMFVGVGAARVRDLFQQANQLSPCIIFIDELDAIGRQRGVHVGNVNDEREHTLNQLLVELDGFEPNSGVIVLSATNRPDVLDPALLRPGRFDRQVVLDAPDARGREAILKVHARGKPLAPEVELRIVARATPGFSGADLANAMNEAALLAARRESQVITQQDLDDAVEKVVAGPERKSRRLSEEEKRRVAYHETGHALIAAHSEHADPVHKISIVPRGRAALGYTLQLPTGDRHLVSRPELIARLTGLLGGRAAEELALGEVSTGAENDLQQATAIARQAVCQFGMGESVGLMHVAQPVGMMAPGDVGWLQRDCSEDTAHAVDEEVKALLQNAYEEARTLLEKHRDQLHRVAEELLERETLDEAEFRALLDGS